MAEPFQEIDLVSRSQGDHQPTLNAAECQKHHSDSTNIFRFTQ